MRADVENAAFVHHDDAVGAADCGESVRDGDDGATGAEPFDRLCDLGFAFGVDLAGGFVEYED